MNSRLLICLLLILSSSLIVIAQNSISYDWLEANVQEIDFDAESPDLSFLKDAIGTRRIVAIGEQTHMDGETFRIRSLMIKYLMEEMNFNVVLFEAGMFDIYVGNEKMKEYGQVDSLKPAIYDFWKGGQCDLMYDYFQYRLDAHKDFEVCGIDMKLTSTYGLNNHNYTNRITEIFKENRPEIILDPNFILYIEFWQKIEMNMQKGGLNRFRYKMNKKEKEELSELSKWVSNKMEEINQPFWSTLIENLDEGIIAYSDLRMHKLILSGMKSMIPANNRRDELMASNLTYLLNERFKDNKVIIIGATYHFIRNNDELDDTKVMGVKLNQSVIMGDILYPEFGNETYTIGFTAFEGEYGMYNEEGEYDQVEKVEKNSLENVLASSEYKTAFVTLNNTINEEFWKMSPSIRLFDYESNVSSAKWSEILDAIFFIKEMKPITK